MQVSCMHILCWESKVSEMSDWGCGRGHGGTHGEGFWELNQGVVYGDN